LAALPNKLIAYQLEISIRTVEVYRAKIMDKLSARGLSEAVRIALLAGVEPLEERQVRTSQTNTVGDHTLQLPI
jgi:two-component system response regulator FixJ